MNHTAKDTIRNVVRAAVIAAVLLLAATGVALAFNLDGFMRQLSIASRGVETTCPAWMEPPPPRTARRCVILKDDDRTLKPLIGDLTIERRDLRLRSDWHRVIDGQYSTAVWSGPGIGSRLSITLTTQGYDPFGIVEWSTSWPL